MRCPNKNTDEWRLLESELGEKEAYKVFIANGEDLPPLSVVQQLVAGLKKDARTNSNYKELKEGIDYTFNITPELSKIGNKEQYSSYIESTFTDSKIKNIVYHGSPNYFEQFDKSKLGSYTGAASAKEGIFFGGSIDVSKSYLDKKGETLDVDEYIKQNPEVIKPTIIGKYREKPNGDGLSEANYTVFKNGKVMVYYGGTSYVTDLDEVIDDFEEPQSRDEYLKWYIKTVKTFKEIVKKQPSRQLELVNAEEQLVEAGKYEPSISIYELSKLIDRNNEVEDSRVAFLEKYLRRQENLKSTYDINYGGYIDKDRSVTDKPFESLFIRPFILSMTNPLITSDEGKKYREESYFERIKKAKEENKDGVIIQDTYDSRFQTKPENVYVVFEIEQVHSLGSKKDIEAFKQFIKSNYASQRVIQGQNKTPDDKYIAEYEYKGETIPIAFKGDPFDIYLSDRSIIDRQGYQSLEEKTSYLSELIEYNELDAEGEAIKQICKKR